eukprot:749817-Pelagomonas_calceolata.AAC.1
MATQANQRGRRDLCGLYMAVGTCTWANIKWESQWQHRLISGAGGTFVGCTWQWGLMHLGKHQVGESMSTQANQRSRRDLCG